MKTLLFCLLLSTCSATDLKPWLSDSLVPYLDTTVGLYTFDDVRVGGEEVLFPENAYFARVGTRFSFEPYGAEVEFGTLGTTIHSWGMEDIRVTGRYQLANDISGDNSYAATVGLSLSYARDRLVEDVAAFHHGPWEALLHLSVGKEFGCGITWTSRVWSVLSFGFANHGSPWFYGKIAAERDWQERVRLGIFTEGLFGMGDHTLDPFIFTGYGPIQHRSIAAGVSGAYSACSLGWIIGEYSFIPWSYNFPVYGHRVLVRWEYPFNL